MLFAEMLELLMAAVIILTLFTQILIPLLRGTPFFPLFRKERNLTKELTEAQEQVRLAEMEAQIEATRKKAADIRERAQTQEHAGGNDR